MRPARHSPEHDFDLEIGTWDTHLRRLVRPLSGSSEWAEYDGTSTVRKIMDGPANLVELDVEGPTGRIRGMSLRLYDPVSGQWSLNFANSAAGGMAEPVVGGFTDGIGEFFGCERVDGRQVIVKFVVAGHDPDVWRFDQSFSADGGRTWELNWAAVDRRRA